MDYRTIREDAAHAGRSPRVHGNGFIQLDLNDDGTRRLHVWDKSVPRQEVATPIHNHVFNLRSSVLRGVLIHEELAPTYDFRGGSHCVYHAEQEPGTQNTILVADGDRVNLAVEQRLILGVGSVYTFPAGKLHQTDHRGTTVTVMEKVALDNPRDYGRPRVLVPVGEVPDNTFHRDGHDPELLWDTLYRALRYVRVEARVCIPAAAA